VLKIAALISGGGRTVINILDAIERRELDASIELVIASRPGIAGIERAAQRGLNVEVVARRGAGSVEAFSAAVFDRIAAAGVTPEEGVVCLAGFLSLLRIPDAYLGRCINIHPALLPRYGGKGMYGDRVHAAVLEAGDTESGCTVHFADNEYDHGPIIGRRRCAVKPDDSVDSLASRVFELECDLYPAVLRAFAENRVHMVNHQAHIEGEI
jgi:phosphoribosylglycinamide formyltransferase-1